MAIKRTTNRVVIMIHDGELKRYFHADLSETLDVVTGRRAYCKVYATS